MAFTPLSPVMLSWPPEKYVATLSRRRASNKSNIETPSEGATRSDGASAMLTGARPRGKSKREYRGRSVNRVTKWALRAQRAESKKRLGERFFSRLRRGQRGCSKNVALGERAA